MYCESMSISQEEYLEITKITGTPQLIKDSLPVPACTYKDYMFILHDPKEFEEPNTKAWFIDTSNDKEGENKEVFCFFIYKSGEVEEKSFLVGNVNTGKASYNIHDFIDLTFGKIKNVVIVTTKIEKKEVKITGETFNETKTSRIMEIYDLRKRENEKIYFKNDRRCYD